MLPLVVLDTRVTTTLPHVSWITQTNLKKMLVCLHPINPA